MANYQCQINLRIDEGRKLDLERLAKKWGVPRAQVWRAAVDALRATEDPKHLIMAAASTREDMAKAAGVPAVVGARTRGTR